MAICWILMKLRLIWMGSYTKTACCDHYNMKPYRTQQNFYFVAFDGSVLKGDFTNTAASQCGIR